MPATVKSVSLALTLEDIDALSDAVYFTLANEVRTEQQRLRLYRLRRRLYRARMELEE